MFELAQINVARMKGENYNDPIMKDFVDNIDRINTIAEKSPGFVWRLKDDNNNSLDANPYGNQQILINVSVWKNVQTLQDFVYNSMHLEIMRRKRAWFNHFSGFYYALWWIPNGKYPSAEDAAEQLKILQEKGPSEKIFTFKEHYPSPRK